MKSIENSSDDNCENYTKWNKFSCFGNQIILTQ